MYEYIYFLLIFYVQVTGEDFVLGMDKGNKEETEVNGIEERKNQKRKTNVKNERTRRGTTITLTLEGFFSFSYFPVLRNDTQICIDLARSGVPFLAYKHRMKS